MGQIEVFNYLLRIIIISYLKSYGYIQIIWIWQKYLNGITNIK